MPEVSDQTRPLIVSRHATRHMPLLTQYHFEQSEDLGLPDFGDKVDMLTFSQILEMDEDETERDFSKPLVMGFFEQAEETFEKMDAAL